MTVFRTTSCGTSIAPAAPYVSGIAALLLEEHPDLTPAELENVITSHVTNADEKTGMGRVAIVDLVSKRPRARAVKH